MGVKTKQTFHSQNWEKKIIWILDHLQETEMAMAFRETVVYLCLLFVTKMKTKIGFEQL